VEQPARPAGGKPPSIEDKTANMKKLEGFIPAYWDEAEGKLYLEVSNFGVEILQSTGFAAGLGSNDIGIDRGALGGESLVVVLQARPLALSATALQFHRNQLADQCWPDCVLHAD